MSYYQPQPTKTRTAIWVGLAVVLLVLAVGAYLLGRDNGGAAASGGPAASTAPVISWSIVGESRCRRRLLHGPRNTEDGLAKGFTHDTLGAALAAVEHRLPAGPRR